MLASYCRTVEYSLSSMALTQKRVRIALDHKLKIKTKPIKSSVD